MQQFQVPQFIDLEDKIIGPLTLKQFFYLLGGTVAIAFLWRFFVALVALPFSLPIALLAIALAFWKPHGRPFPVWVKSFLAYTFRPRLYLWHKVPPKAKKEEMKEASRPDTTPRITESKIQELAWSLDIKQKVKR